jgi:peptide-methionine (R)-S-oxide reductase
MEPRDLGGKEANKVDEAEWKNMLSPEQYRILRQKGTEYPGTGEYNKFYPKSGTFYCAGCHVPLYTSKSKFDSGCGWPAFYEGIDNNVLEVPDADGMRVEIVCNNCGGHLGHVFKGEGFKTPTNARHCVNSVSVKYME